MTPYFADASPQPLDSAQAGGVSTCAMPQFESEQ